MAAVEVRDEEPVATMAAEEATEESVFVKWRWVFALSTLLLALLLFGALLYLHIEQEQQQQQELQSMQLQLELGNQLAEMPSTSGKKMPINAEDYNYNSNQSTNNDVLNSDEYYDEVDYNHDDDAADNKADQNDASNAELVVTPSPSIINSTSMRSATETAAVKVAVQSPISEQHQFMACHNEGLQLAASAASLQDLPSGNCLQCICETGTECRPVKCSSGVYCGLFRISMPYWMDAGRPRLSGVDNGNMADDEAHLQCVNDPCCAARTVTEFVQKYARDCNHDGKIDCSDYAALHILGAGGCMRQALSPIFEYRLAKCMARLF